ncbi:MAG TPA: hypothetical protein VGD21_14800 [Lysobacter sp.]
MGQYGAVIGGVIGAIVGTFVPGVGTAFGWAIGSALGGAYSASQQVLPGPKIGDVQQQTSQEGGFRPLIFGRSHPIMGNVIADSEPVIVKKRERQGKGGPKVETEYAYRTYAVGFCEGDAQLLQVWRNGILVYDSEDTSMTAENAKFLEYATWHSGSFEQMPDPDLQAIYGANDTPFFRGTAYLVLASEDVTDQRGAWSQWQVRVFRGAGKVMTSAPYALVAEDAIEANATLSPGSFINFGQDSLGHVSLSFPDGELRAQIVTFDSEDDLGITGLAFPAGELRQVIVTMDGGGDELGVTGLDFPGGALVQTVVIYDDPGEDGVEISGLTFPAGTMA